MDLIETEIAFNQAVTDTLEEVQRLSQQLESGHAALRNGKVSTAIDVLQALDEAIGNDTFFSNTNVMSILSTEVARFRQEIEEALHLRWTEQLKFDRRKGEFHLFTNERADSLENTIVSLSRLGLLAPANDRFQKDLISTIIDPILLPRKGRTSHGVTVLEDGIHVDPQPSVATVAETLNRITSVLNYLREKLPSSISVSLSPSLIQVVASKAIAGWLASEIPTDLDGLGEFEMTLDHVLQFAKTIESWGWSGQEELVSWVKQAPRLWLTRRRVDSLDSVRKVLATSKGTTKRVERVEREKVSQAEGALLENAANDDWDAEWDEEKEEVGPGEASNTQPQEEDEDLDAWGLDEEEQQTLKEEAGQPATASTEDDDAAEVWGWGDDEEEKGDQNHPSQASLDQKQANGGKAAQTSSPREVTLTEVYTITDIPDSVLRIIQQQIADSKDITKPP